MRKGKRSGKRKNAQSGSLCQHHHDESDGFSDTELEKWCKDGSFVQASGRERIEELAYLLEALELTTPTGFSTSHVTNPVMITGTLPYDKEKMLEGVYKMLGSGKESDLHGIVSISDAAIER